MPTDGNTFRAAVARALDRRGSGDQQLDCALMASVQKRLAEVAAAVAAIRPLAELPEHERRECAKTSAIQRYPAKSVVYDDDRDAGQADAHFVLEGRCVCVQRLHVRKTTAFGRDRFTLVRDAAGRDDVSTVYVKMSKLRVGSAFGLGEIRPGRLVVATADVKYLLVPSTFLAKHNMANVWGRAVCSSNWTDPTVEQSFRKYVVDNRWAEYRRSMAEDAVNGPRTDSNGHRSVTDDDRRRQSNRRMTAEFFEFKVFGADDVNS